MHCLLASLTVKTRLVPASVRFDPLPRPNHHPIPTQFPVANRRGTLGTPRHLEGSSTKWVCRGAQADFVADE
jgi:hypothetical protein